jgi:hypothetical protein
MGLPDLAIVHDHTCANDPADAVADAFADNARADDALADAGPDNALANNTQTDPFADSFADDVTHTLAVAIADDAFTHTLADSLAYAQTDPLPDSHPNKLADV